MRSGWGVVAAASSDRIGFASCCLGLRVGGTRLAVVPMHWFQACW